MRKPGPEMKAIKAALAAALAPPDEAALEAIVTADAALAVRVCNAAGFLVPPDPAVPGSSAEIDTIAFGAVLRHVASARDAERRRRAMDGVAEMLAVYLAGGADPDDAAPPEFPPGI